MTAADTVLFALRQYYHREPDANAAAVNTLAEYDADVIAQTNGRLRDFTPVFTTSDGTDVPATELRDVLCDGLIQGIGPHSLLDLTELAAQHDCQGGPRG